MNMRQKQTHLVWTSLALAVSALILLALSAGTTYYVFHRNSQAPIETTQEEPVKSKFSFTGASGWWQGATNETSMAVFDSNNQMACFTSAEYKPGVVDTTSELQKVRADLESSGYTVTPLTTQTLAMQIAGNTKQYELHQSSVTSPSGSEKLKGGQEFGFIQLETGYIKVMGYCDSPDQLPSTLPPIRAITYSNTPR